MTTRPYRLGEICTFAKGTYPIMKTEPGQYPLVVTAAFRRTANTYQIEGPAVCIPLISSTGHGDAALHRVHYQEGRFALATLLVALLPKAPTAYCPMYLYHLLNAKKDALFVPLMQGTANVSLKIEDIAGVEVTLPPLTEQRRIVGRIEELSRRVLEAQSLRKATLTERQVLLIALAHRSDLGAAGKLARGWREKQLSDCLEVASEPTRVSFAGTYPNIGIYSFGRGLFRKRPIEGSSTSARELFRVHRGQFIYSRLFAFEGAYGVVAEEFDGSLVSNEYPTFNCDETVALPEFVAAYFKSPGVWTAVAAGSKGIGHRRQRVQPAQLLAHRLLVPPIAIQAAIRQVWKELEALKAMQEKTAAELDALMPSILDKAFRGEL